MAHILAPCWCCQPYQATRRTSKPPPSSHIPKHHRNLYKSDRSVAGTLLSCLFFYLWWRCTRREALFKVTMLPEACCFSDELFLNHVVVVLCREYIMLQYFGIEVENHRDNRKGILQGWTQKWKYFRVKEQEAGERQDVWKIQISNATMCKMWMLLSNCPPPWANWIH